MGHHRAEVGDGDGDVQGGDAVEEVEVGGREGDGGLEGLFEDFWVEG